MTTLILLKKVCSFVWSNKKNILIGLVAILIIYFWNQNNELTKHVGFLQQGINTAETTNSILRMDKGEIKSYLKGDNTPEKKEINSALKKAGVKPGNVESYEQTTTTTSLPKPVDIPLPPVPYKDTSTWVSKSFVIDTNCIKITGTVKYRGYVPKLSIDSAVSKISSYIIVEKKRLWYTLWIFTKTKKYRISECGTMKTVELIKE